MVNFDFGGKVRFGVHTTPVQEKEVKLAAHIHQIVLKGPDGIIIRNGYTGLERFAYPYNGHPILHGLQIPPAKYKLLYICKCLNFLMYSQKIATLSDVTLEMLYNCFEIYRTSEISPGSNTFVEQCTLDKFVSTICSFFANMALENTDMKFEPTELFEQVTVYSRTNLRGKGTVSYVPIYRQKALQCRRRELLRDIPEAAIYILMEECKKHDRMIYFAVVLQIYGGLRASECMNLRRKNSPLSTTPGIELHYVGTSVTEIYLDLTQEYRMRRDGVDVGKIKRETSSMTQIYHKNIPVVLDAYEEHLKLLSTSPYEEEYAPMFVSSGGKAMTTDTYQRRFNGLIHNHLCPRLLKHSDPQLVAWGQALLTHNFPTHGLHHYFTVRLAMDGLDAAQIMAYRGDRNVDSAVVYLQHKGILEEQLRNAHSIALVGLVK